MRRSLHHPEPLVAGGHLEEVPEALLEDLPPPPGGRDPADADPLVGLRKAPEVPPDLRIPLEPLQRDPEVWRNFRRFPESYKRIRIGWIAAARRRREVFEQRLRYFLKMTARNKRFGMVQ